MGSSSAPAAGAVVFDGRCTTRALRCLALLMVFFFSDA